MRLNVILVFFCVLVSYNAICQSSGEIQLYFNSSLNEDFSDGTGDVEGTSGPILEKAILDLIDSAEKTLDIMAYNCNRTNFVNAIIDAVNRGVRVRYITDDQTTNSALNNGLPFPIVYGNTGNPLMHNKIIIVDVEDDKNTWVLTGSTNFTTGQMLYDPNHIILIQDQALAEAYTLEFDEMWGGTQDEPDLSKAKFGEDKTDNTPHEFNIGGIPMELYFSPSDSAAEKVADAIKTANHSMMAALLIFTRYEIRDAIIEAYNSNKDFRVILDDDNESGEIEEDLENKGIQVKSDNNNDIFHHKYAIIDEGTNSDPIVITGSMNWTYSGGNYNDENTLIIHDQAIANVFRQEFEQHWGPISSTKEKVDSKLAYFTQDSNLIIISKKVEAVSLYNLKGARVAFYRNPKDSIDLSLLPPGQYVAVIQNKGIKSTVKCLVSK